VTSGKVLHGTYNGVQVLRYVGDIRYTLSLSLDSYIKGLLSNRELRGFVADLTATDAIDSTNLGILARLARSMQRSQLPKVTLISNRPAINEVLEGMGFDRVFCIVPESESELEKLREIPVTLSDDGAMMRLLLESHLALMEMNEHNRKMFRDVVEAVEKELHQDGERADADDKRAG